MTSDERLRTAELLRGALAAGSGPGPEAYVEAARAEQEARRPVDEWERLFAEALGRREGRLGVDDAWRLVGLYDPSRRGQRENFRLSEALAAQGWKRRRVRSRGERIYCYQRGASEEWISDI